MSKFVILHKKKDTLNRSCCIMKLTKQTLQHLRKKVPISNTIHHSTFIYSQFKKLNLCKYFSNRVIGHFMSILISIFISGYHGKTTDFAQNHRTFPQFREIGWYLTWKYFKILRSWNYLFRNTAHRKACFLYCGWYHSFKDKAFVTGSASNWRCVSPLWLLVCFWKIN